MKKILVYSRVGQATTEFETSATTFVELLPGFWKTIGVEDNTNLKILDDKSRSRVTNDFIIPDEGATFFVMQDNTKNNTTIQQLEAELAKARKLKKSTKDIKAKIAAMTEEMMDDDEEQVEETPSMFSNVKINENCVPAEVATLLNKN